jgi:hypothetical protein
MENIPKWEPLSRKLLLIIKSMIREKQEERFKMT